MKPCATSLQFSQLIFTCLTVLSGLCGRALYAQDSSPIVPLSSNIEAPIPKSGARELFALGRPSIALGLLQGSAELFDGIGTHRYVHAASCPTCTEVDPVCRLFLGPRPTWPRMLALGTVEDLNAVYLQQSMRRSPRKMTRWFALAAPLTLIGIHLGEGIPVFTASTNVCSVLGPGYVVSGENGNDVFCTRPSPPPSAALGGQLRPRR